MSLENINEKKLTPMLKHWYSVKKQYPEYLLAYRMGDFYEFFYNDAERISKLLGITLTKRKVANDSYPLAGIPYHANNYLKNLVNLGQTVVVVDQLEDPSKVKGRIVKRGVVRILTPGTVVEAEMLNNNRNNFIAALIKEKKGFGVAFSDISTGEFLTLELKFKEEKDPVEKLLSVFSEYDPIELIVPEDLKKDERLFLLISDLTKAIVKSYDDYVFNYSEAYSLLTKQFKVSNLRGFGLDKASLAIKAAGGLLYFLKETQRSLIPNIYSIQLLKQKQTLHIDYITQRNLELISSLRDKGKETTLYSIFNHTHTPMGSRLLKKSILNPLTNIEQINFRLDIVEELKNNVILRADLREVLKEFGDLIRFVNRLNYFDRSNARDLVNLSNSLEKIPKIKHLLKDLPATSKYFSIGNLRSFQMIRSLIHNSIKENPSSNLKDGNIIKDGYNNKVDELRDLIKNGKRYVLEYESEQREKLNLNSGLKIGFNNILGYYIQITKNTLKSISHLPEEYIERQTLKNAKRYTSSELKSLENKIVKAEEEINDLEYKLFCEIRDEVVVHTPEIIQTADVIAEIDVLACFAEISELYGYIRPEMTNHNTIAIKEGRHPVVERLQITEKFIPNDCYLDTNTEQIRIVTGPNMAGKCVHEDTLIFTEFGILPIKEFKSCGHHNEKFEELKIELLGINGVEKTSQFYSDGIKESRIIKTSLGYSIEGSLIHPVLVRDPSGSEIWKGLSNVTKNDYLIINRKFDLWGKEIQIKYTPPIYETKTKANLDIVKTYKIPNELTEDLAYLMGLLTGDGTLTYKHSYNLSTHDNFLKKEFYRINKDIFDYDAKSKKKNKTEHFVSSLFLRDFLYHLGLDYSLAHQKKIPDTILKAPKNIVKAYLQGLFDTDGTADNKYGNVSYSTSSEKLASQIHILLLNFGIISTLRSKKTPARVNFNIDLYGENSIKFYREIDFRLNRKSKRKTLLSKKRMTNINSIPYFNDTLKSIQNRIVEKSSMIPHNDKLKYNKKIGGIFYSYIRQNRNISFNKLKELINYCQKYEIDHEELKEVYNNKYFYDKIENIKNSKAQLYDFVVPGSHSFIGNGIINHNSTYLRQVALICLIGQMGCFVPAKSAKIGIIDQIFTRIGASDDLARNLSTFMIEASEVAKILNYATPKSLVIVDELGRGTSTSDGLSIAMATLEKLHALKCKTLFSTHFHQITENNLPRVKNYHLNIIENQDGSIYFVRKLEPGVTDKSYGIHVAKLAGIPEDVIKRAFEILEEINDRDPFNEKLKSQGILERKISRNKPTLNQKSNDLPIKTVQTSLFKPIAITENKLSREAQLIIDELNRIDIESITPIDAMRILIDLKEKLSKSDS